MRFLFFLVTVAWRNLWRHKRRSLITAGAMAVGVGLCMSMVAITDGMMAQFERVLIDQQLGHVQVHHVDYLETRSMYDAIDDGMAKVQAVEALPQTTAASVRLVGYGLLGGESKSAGAQIVGIDPVREQKILRIKIEQGTFLPDEADGSSIVIGAGLAEELEVGVGAELVAVTQAADGSTGNALYTVKGIYKTGNAVMDKNGAYLNLSDLQELLVMEGKIHELTLLTANADDLEGYRDAVEGAVGGGLSVLTWRQVSPQTAEMMGMQDFSIGIILSIVFLVTAFGIINTMMMSVFERTRELGVLKALGLRPMRMVALVVVESILLAGLSAAAGLLLGGFLDYLLVVYGLDMGVEDGLEFQGIMMDPHMYGIVRPGPIIVCVLAVFFVSAIASLYPAWRAARLQPVEAIRTE